MALRAVLRSGTARRPVAARQRAYQAEVTERNGQKVTKVFAGYKDRPDSWVMDQAKGTATEPPPWLGKNGKPIAWYAGKQYDDDTADAKKVLSELDKHYPGATKYKVAGFFFWQGEKDCGNAHETSSRFRGIGFQPVRTASERDRLEAYPMRPPSPAGGNGELIS